MEKVAHGLVGGLFGCGLICIIKALHVLLVCFGGFAV